MTSILVSLRCRIQDLIGFAKLVSQTKRCFQIRSADKKGQWSYRLLVSSAWKLNKGCLWNLLKRISSIVVGNLILFLSIIPCITALQSLKKKYREPDCKKRPWNKENLRKLKKLKLKFRLFFVGTSTAEVNQMQHPHRRSSKIVYAYMMSFTKLYSVEKKTRHENKTKITQTNRRTHSLKEMHSRI